MPAPCVMVDRVTIDEILEQVRRGICSLHVATVCDIKEAVIKADEEHDQAREHNERHTARADRREP